VEYYTLHSQHNLTDKKQYEVVSKDSKEEILSELINYFEVVGLQYKGYDNGEIELMMLIDDNYKIQVDDETGKDKDKINKVILTLNTLTSIIEDMKIDSNMDEELTEGFEDDSETKELKTNIPSNPFMIDGDDDLYETDELNTKQNMMFMDYLKRKGWSFSDWWKNEGEERIKEHITDIRNDGNINYKDEIGWWDEYFKENIEVFGDRLVEGCSLYRRIYIPMKVRKGEFEDLEKWEQQYFLDGITKGYWDTEGNHIGDNSNPYVKKKRITES